MTRKRSDGIVSLLDAEDRELRWAAAKVLGAIGGDEATVRALSRCLQVDDSRLRLAALRSIASIGKGDAFAEVAPLLAAPGDVGHAAMEVLAGMGPSILTKLKPRFDTAGETGRRRILTLAARLRGAHGIGIIVRALETGHADEVAGLGGRLGEELVNATARERGTVVRKLDAFLAKKGQGSDPGAVTAVLDLLSRLAGPKAQGRLLEYSKAGNPPRIRRRALESLARIMPGAKVKPEVVDQLLGLMRDGDFTNVVAPAMSALESARIDAAHAPRILACLNDPDPALRRFGVAALGQIASPAAVQALIDVLLSDNPDLQRRAADSLSRQQGPVAPIVEALVGAPDARVAWVLARALAPRLHKVTRDQASRLASAAADWLAPGDPRSEPALTILREKFPAALEDAALKKVAKIRKKRLPGEIINLLTPVIREGPCRSVRGRYELALAELMRGGNDVVRDIRLKHVGLQDLEALYADPSFDLAAQLRREKKILEPDEFYLVGFHFAERTYGDKVFGGDLLRWIVKTFPGSAAARAAEHKLLMEGFPPPPQPKPKAKRRARKKKLPNKPVKEPAAKPTTKVSAKKAVAKKAAKKAIPKNAPAKKKAVAKKTAKKAPAKKKATPKKAAKKASASRSKTPSRKKSVAKKARRTRS